MDYSELIYNYLDGELPPILEDKLFAEMSINQDLRNEFAKQIKINNFALNDLNSIQIPSDVTSKVFSNLGFSIPANNLMKSNFAINKNWIKNNKYRLAVLISTILVLSISGTLLLKDAFDSNNVLINSQRNSFSNVVNQNTENNLINQQNEASIPLASSLIDRNSSIKGKQKNQTNSNLSNSNYYLKNQNSSIISKSDKNKEIIQQNKSNDIAEKLYLEDIKQPNNLNTNYKQSIATLTPANFDNFSSNTAINYFHQNEFNNQLMLIPDVKSNFELTINTRAFRNSKSIAFADEKSFFSGSSISLMYKINEEHYIGGSFGENEFYQEFLYHNGDQLTLYQQMPNYYWGTFSYKYIPKYLNIGNIAQIYAKTGVGGCKAGVIGELQLGLNIPITQSLNGFIAGDYSTLIYNINREFYNSNKFEILYGISLNL